MAKHIQLALTPDNIESENSKYNQQKKITFSTGEFAYINKFFHPQKIQEMLIDMAHFLANCEKAGIEVNDEDLTLYIKLHTIKHFSNICAQFPVSIEEKVDFLNRLSKHPCVIELWNKFDNKEEKKIYDQIFKNFNEFVDRTKENKDVREALLNKVDALDIENKDIVKDILIHGNNPELSI